MTTVPSTSTVKQGTNRPAAKARATRAAQRTPLPGDEPTKAKAGIPALDCSGGEEAHNEHMALNGECPWCDAEPKPTEAPAKADKTPDVWLDEAVAADKPAKRTRKAPAKAASSTGEVAAEVTAPEAKPERSKAAPSASQAKADALAATLKPFGWAIAIEAKKDDRVEVTATRDTERLFIAWTKGVYEYPATYAIGERTRNMRNASEAKRICARKPAE